MPILNRNLCTVLEEMRQTTKTLNFSYLLGLIEEVQSMGNRMEAAISDGHDIEWQKREAKRLKKEIKRLKEKKEAAGGKSEINSWDE